MTRLVRFANNATSKLASNVSAVGLTISLTPGDGGKFPSLSGGQFFMGTLVKADGTKEVVKVTARSTDTLTITRAAESVGGVQTAYAFTAGDKFELRLTAEALEDELDRLDAAAFLEVSNKDANYTITEADVSKLIKTDSSSGAIVHTLPEISTLTSSFEIQISKDTGDANTVTVARAGTDTINGLTSYVLGAQYQCVWLVADLVNEAWTAVTSASATNAVVDVFTGDGTADPLTLSGNPGTKNNTTVHVGGVYQNKSTYTLVDDELTLGGAVGIGVLIEVEWAQPLAIGTPSDGTVSTAKIIDSAITTAKLAANSVTASKIPDGSISLTKTTGIAASGANSDISSLDALTTPISLLVLRSYLAGCAMSTAGSSATMSIAAGAAMDSTNAYLMQLSAISKTTSAWAVGTGNGGLDTGSIANSTWYYFYAIRRPDTNVVDVVFSTSSSAPTLPTNYTQYRYIGAGLTNGSAQWTRFTQVGDYFQWYDPPLDIDATTNTTAALSTLSVPRGRKVLSKFNLYVSDGTSGAGRIYISDPDTLDKATSSSASPLATIIFNGSTSDFSAIQAECWTNTSAQIRRVGQNSTNYCRLVTLGWVDNRGRDI